MQQKKVDEAIAEFERAIEFQRDHAGAHFNLGYALAGVGWIKDAVEHFREALKWRPDQAKTHHQLGLALRSLNQLDAATEELDRARRLAPQTAEICFDLGTVEARRGQTETALASLREAIRLRPDWVEPLNYTAWLMATHSDRKVRRPHDAVDYAERAATLTARRDPAILDTLAAAYAASQRFDEAVTTAEEAVELARLRGSSDLADRAGARLALYRLRKPYREPRSPKSTQ